MIDLAGIDKITIYGLEDYRGRGVADNLIKVEKPNLKIRNGDEVDKHALLQLSRLCLRELMWAQFEAKGQFFIHFGNDFYMYIGCIDGKEKIPKIQNKTKLYIEEFRSPYLSLQPKTVTRVISEIIERIFQTFLSNYDERKESHVSFLS
tara:strand:- start:41 stop:487 length:447 start_codon:yes stop_codon:yes gene_type:complete